MFGWEGEAEKKVEKIKIESLICVIDKNVYVHLHMSFISFLFIYLFLNFCFPWQRWLFFLFYFLCDVASYFFISFFFWFLGDHRRNSALFCIALFYLF